MPDTIYVVNALLRCVRDDQRAAPLFEAMEEVRGLWVYELPVPLPDPFEQWQESVTQILVTHQEQLRALKGSSDYCLHVALGAKPTGPGLLFNADFVRAVASVGCGLEVVCD